MPTHTYATSLTWAGSTGEGYGAYTREHSIRPGGSPELRLSADPAFCGDPGLPNPELLLLAAASSCQLLSFLAVAARARVDVIAYTDEASAMMPEDDLPVRITQITLRPLITVRRAPLEKVERLVRLAHDECYIANTLKAEMLIEPVITVVD